MINSSGYPELPVLESEQTRMEHKVSAHSCNAPVHDLRVKSRTCTVHAYMHEIHVNVLSAVLIVMLTQTLTLNTMVDDVNGTTGSLKAILVTYGL